MIDDIQVIFPFPQAYPEQLDYMKELKLGLDAERGPIMLEMPSGTGKTVCLLSLILAYMEQKENVGPLIYCTRTIPEMNQGIAELKRVMKIRKELGNNDQFDQELLAISLACRYYLCVNQEAAEQKTKKDVDTQCRARTIQSSENHCDFFEHVLLRPKAGVYSLDDLRSFGAANGLCPYFLSKRLIKEAQVIFCSFAYTLDPGASEAVFKNCGKQSIVVFDEAHNIDDVCCEFISWNVSQETLDLSAIALDEAQTILNERKRKEMGKLQDAFDNMKRKLQDRAASGKFFASHETMDMLSKPQLPQKVIEKAMPSSIKNFDTFIDDARKIIKFLTGFIQGTERPRRDFEVSVDALLHNQTNANPTLAVLDTDIERYPPNLILGLIQQKCGITPAALHSMGDRLTSFVENNKIPNYEVFVPMFDMLEFTGLLSAYDDGFTVFVEQTQTGPVMQIACLDCTLTFEPVLRHFNRIVITSGTLSPLSFYPKLLNFQPVSTVCLTMSFSRQCLLPILGSRGYLNAPLTSSFKQRTNPNVGKGYGLMLLEYSKIVPDGIVGFFPSYVYMNQLIKEWMNDGTMEEILHYKLVFIETANAEETAQSLENYNRACDNGRGAIFLGVARGRISEGIDFSDHYGRCVILFGLPVRNTQSIVVQARAEYIYKKLGIPKEDFLVFDAMRAASQCVGRLLRSKKDYGVVVLADRRYAQKECRSQMPHWINEYIDPTKPRGLCVEESFDVTRKFMIQMAQPFVLDISKLRRLNQSAAQNPIQAKLRISSSDDELEMSNEQNMPPSPDPLLA